MKHLCLFGLMALLSSTAAFAHGDEEQRVAIEPESTTAVGQKETVFKFQMVDTKSKTLVTGIDLNVTHEKKLHFLVYDPALREFQHVHPEFDGAFWQVPLHFNVSGEYWVWAQGELKDREEFSSSTRLTVEIGKPAWPSPPRLSDIRTGASGKSTVTLSNQKLRAGKMVMLNVTIRRNDSSEPNVTPYLGAFAHIIATPDDGDSLLHVHPMNGSKPNEGMIHVNFPRKGFYRLWIQFIDGGDLKTIPLSVEVF